MITRTFVVTGLMAVIAWMALPGMTNPVVAQSSFSVYSVYDGFINNSDGTLTLPFAYFSHNREAVTIPIGPDNLFSPGPGNRGQPEMFLPGHHRWQCIVVVD